MNAATLDLKFSDELYDEIMKLASTFIA